MIPSARVVSFPLEKNPTVIYPTDGALALASDFSPASVVREIRRASPVEIIPFPGAFERARIVSPSTDSLNAGGLWNLNRARYYDPQIGRFLKDDDYGLETVRYIPEDPNDPKTGNGYIYVLNNPIKYRDNGGLSATVGAPSLDVAGAGVIIGLLGAAAAAVFLPRIADATFAVMQLNEHIRSLNIFTTLISASVSTSLLFAESEKRKAEDIISDEKKGSINSEFPSEMKNKTLNEIKDLAKQGNAAARKAKKLLTDKRFNK